MLPVSARWAVAITGNHEVVQRVDAVKSGVVTRGLPVTGWRVFKDAGSSPRTTATVTFADTSLLPADAAGLLTPFGTRLRFHRGIRYPDGTADLPLLAELEIRDVTMARPEMTLDVGCADASARIGDAQFTGPYPAANTSALAEIAHQAITRVPGMAGVTVVSTGVTDVSVPTATVWDGDRWVLVEQLADLLAAEAFMSADGRSLIVRPTPVPKTTADALLYTGTGGTVTRTATSLTRAPNYVALWSDPDDAGRSRAGTAGDLNPASPTYVYGPYGYVIAQERRPGPPASKAIMDAAAGKLLKRYQGQTRTCVLDAVPNPAIECGDTVQIRFFGGTIERHVVQSVEIPGSAGETMTVSTRAPGTWAG